VGCVLARYGDDTPRTDSLVYTFDHDTGSALWVSTDPAPDAWVSARMPRGMVDGPLPGFTRSDRVVHRAPGPMPPPGNLLPPEIELRSDTKTEGTRTLSFQIRLSHPARCVKLWDAGGARILRAMSVDGVPVRDFYRFSPEADEAAMRRMVGDDSYRVWRMEHCGLGESGRVDVALEAIPGSAVRLRVVEESEGMPENDGPALPRPRGFIPAPGSDVTLAGRTFTL